MRPPRLLLALGLLPLALVAASPLTPWYERPATQWVEALPGGINQERIPLNKDTL